MEGRVCRVLRSEGIHLAGYYDDEGEFRATAARDWPDGEWGNLSPEDAFYWSEYVTMGSDAANSLTYH